ncbi:MAG: hypothetical protein WCP06_12695 [Verrucomicrobiota bacterium]
MPDGATAARDISPLVRTFKDEIAKGAVPQGKLAQTDDEFLMPRWAKLKVVKKTVQETATGKLLTVVLREGRS